MASELKGGATVAGYQIWHAGNFTPALDKLTNVTVTSVASGHFLKWNGTAWVNTALVAADIPSLDAGKITTGTLNTAQLPSATTGAQGAVILSTATNDTSTTKAGSASSVKAAYDLAALALPLAGGTMTGQLLTTTESKLQQAGVTWVDPHPSVSYSAKAESITANILRVKDKNVWHAGNFDPATKSDTTHIHAVISDTEPTTGLYNGYMWYNATADKTKVYLNGAFRSVGGGSVSRTNTKEVTLGAAASTATIGISGYVKGVDTLFVFQNSTYMMESTDYIIAADGLTITKISGTWTAGTILQFVVITTESSPVIPDTVTIAQVTNRVVTTNGQTNIPIGIPEYNASLDVLEVYQDNTYLYPNDQYTVSADKLSINLVGYVADATNTFFFKVTKKIRTGVTSSQVDGALLITASIPQSALNFSLPVAYKGASAPGTPASGDLWYDTSINRLKYYNGSSWMEVSAIPKSTTAPVAPLAGDQWYDTAANKMKYYNGTSWIG